MITNYLTLPISVIYNLFSKKLLGEVAPLLTAHAVFVGSFTKYFDIIFFPFNSSMSREIPLLKNMNQTKMDAIEYNVFTVAFIISSVASMFFFLLGYFSNDLLLRLVFYAIGAATIFKFLHKTINVYLGAHGKFVRKSKVALYVTLIKFPICLLLIFFYKEIGYVISLFLTTALVGVFYVFLVPWSNIHLNINFRLLIELLKKSLPFTIYLGIETILFTIDKFLIRATSIENLGLYGFAFQVTFLIYETPKKIYSTLFPFLLKDIRAKNFSEIAQNIFFIQQRMQFILSLMLMLAFASFNIIIDVFLPYFKGAEKYAGLLFLIPYVFSSNYIFYIYLLGKRLDKPIIFISLISICIASILYSIAFWLKISSELIPFIIIFVLLINNILTIGFVFNKYHISSVHFFFQLKSFMVFVAPYLLLIIPEYIKTDTFIQTDIHNIFHLITRLFISLAILIILTYYLENKVIKYFIQESKKAIRRFRF